MKQKNYVICGIDTHEKNLVCKVCIDKGKAIRQDFNNTKKGRKALFTMLKILKKKNNATKIVCAYEASTLGYGLYDECLKAGIDCYVLAPTKMKRSKKDKKNKTDEKDAEKILETLRGHLLAGNELPSIWIPDHATRDDREIVRIRLDVGEKLTKLKGQVQMLLKRAGIKKPSTIGESWTIRYKIWLNNLQMKPGLTVSLRSLLRQISDLESEIKELDKEIKKLALTPKYLNPALSLVEKIKGVGLLTAMVFLTEFGVMNRFKNRKQIGAYLGLVPSIYETGATNDRKGHITREGSSRVRRVLCQAAWSRVRYNEKEKEVYQRIVARNPKHKKIAVVASMRRLGILMWHIALDAQIKNDEFIKLNFKKAS